MPLEALERLLGPHPCCPEGGCRGSHGGWEAPTAGACRDCEVLTRRASEAHQARLPRRGSERLMGSDRQGKTPPWESRANAQVIDAAQAARGREPVSGAMPAEGSCRSAGPVPVASRLDSARVLASVVPPIVARGVPLRRPPIVAMAERVDADRRAVRSLQRLRRRYGPGPVRLPAGRKVAVVLSPDQVHEVLDRPPETFVVSNLEKRGRAVALPAGGRPRRGRAAPGRAPAVQRSGARHPSTRAPAGRRHRGQGQGGGPARRRPR
jgi:hypothetical protein